MNVQQAMRNVDEKTVKLFREHQTLIRRAYLNAHIAILGDNNWTFQDTENFEAIDIMIAKMLQASGHLIERVPQPHPFGGKPKGEPLNDKQREELEREIQAGVK